MTRSFRALFRNVQIIDSARESAEAAAASALAAQEAAESAESYKDETATYSDEAAAAASAAANSKDSAVSAAGNAQNYASAAAESSEDSASYANSAQTSAQNASAALATILAFATAHEVTLDAEDWDDNEQTVQVTGVTAYNTVLVAYAPASREAYHTSDIHCTSQGNGTLTFECADAPQEDVAVNVLILDEEGESE